MAIIIKKNICVGGQNYLAECEKHSQIYYELKISALDVKKEEQEFKEHETVLIKESFLRPSDKGLTAKDRQANQDKIDVYLKTKSIDEALTAVDEKQRVIEKDLGFFVEKYLKESKVVKEIPVIREVDKTELREVAKVPFYFRPSTGIVSKTINNYVKHSALQETKNKSKSK